MKLWNTCEPYSVMIGMRQDVYSIRIRIKRKEYSIRIRFCAKIYSIDIRLIDSGSFEYRRFSCLRWRILWHLRLYQPLPGEGFYRLF